MRGTCTCGHDKTLHGTRTQQGIWQICRRIGCHCPRFTPSRATGDETPAGASDKTTTATTLEVQQ